MTEPDQLFNLPDDAAPAPGAPPTPPAPIRDEQVAEIREAFEAAGIDSMDERRALIESCVLRPVASVRELLAKDVRGVLERVAARAAAARTDAGVSGLGTAWDDRTEDTWIDRL